MKSGAEFSFDFGSMVKGSRKGVTGTVVARIEWRGGRISYRYRDGDGNEHEAPEGELSLVHCVPDWARPGVEVRWVGQGDHDLYTVESVVRGGRHLPWKIRFERRLYRPDGTSCGRQLCNTYCTPEDMRYWQPVTQPPADKKKKV